MSLFITLLTTSPVPQLGQQSGYSSGLLPHVSYVGVTQLNTDSLAEN